MTVNIKIRTNINFVFILFLLNYSDENV